MRRGRSLVTFARSAVGRVSRSIHTRGTRRRSTPGARPASSTSRNSPPTRSIHRRGCSWSGTAENSTCELCGGEQERRQKKTSEDVGRRVEGGELQSQGDRGRPDEDVGQHPR